MGGSKPEWADSDDHATLEEVFASRTFGHPRPDPSALTEGLPAVASPRLYFVRNRFIASASAAAAALSVVAGVTFGPGPIGQVALSSHSGDVPPAVDTTPPATPNAPAVPPHGSGGAGELTGSNQPTGATQVAHAQAPTVTVNAIAARRHVADTGGAVTPTPT